MHELTIHLTSFIVSDLQPGSRPEDIHHSSSKQLVTLKSSTFHITWANPNIVKCPSFHEPWLAEELPCMIK